MIGRLPDAACAARHSLRKASIAQIFLIVSLAVTVLPMVLLGFIVNDEVKSAKVRSVAIASAVHFRAAAEPFLVDGPPSGVLPRNLERRLDRWFVSHPAGTLEAAHIWLRDGTIAYSTIKAMVGQVVENDRLADAFDGETTAEFELSDDGREHIDEARKPLLEIYLPLRSATGEVVAVGEIYLYAEPLIAQLNRTGQRIWAIVIGVSLSMMLLSFLVVRQIGSIVTRQRAELKRRLSNSIRLAKLNANLRRTAIRTRTDAINTNEDLLNQIGSDLHDGPLQLLSLLVLQLKTSGDASSRKADAAIARRDAHNIELATDAIRDLRNLSYGLILPELQTLDVEETLRLAVIRHENITATKVATKLSQLSIQIELILKICLYRVVQESLTNAFRHAEGVDQRVTATAAGDHIEVEISNGRPVAADTVPSATSIGMLGLARRVAAVDGELTVERNPSGGTTVRARLPLALNPPATDQPI